MLRFSRYARTLNEFARSDDLYDLLSLVQSGQEVIMVVFDEGSVEFADQEYYKEYGREMLAKTRGKKVAKVYKLSAEEMIG